MSVNSKMTAIANKIRTLLGITGTMGLDTMASNIGKAQEEVDDQAALIEQLRTILAGKAGGIIPAGYITIDKNGIHDVTQYKDAVVNVPLSSLLPNGVNAISSGTFNLNADTGDSSNAYKILHGLGTTPNFYAVFADSSDFMREKPKNTIACIFAIAQKVVLNDIYHSYYAIEAYSRDNGNLTTNYSYSDTDDDSMFFDSEHINVWTYSNSVLKAGITYRWIAGHLANLDY